MEESPLSESSGPAAKSDRGNPLIPALAVAGGLTAFVGLKWEIPLAVTAGFCLIGAASTVLGIEVMRTKRIVLRSRYDRRARETYTGIAAVAQGIDLILLGALFMGGALLSHLGRAGPLVRLLIQRPGPLLIVFGFTCLTGAVTVGVGFREQRQTSRLVYVLDLLTGRVLGGVVLAAFGLAAIGLGAVELIAPDLFDAWGGGYLEVLFGETPTDPPAGPQ